MKTQKQPRHFATSIFSILLITTSLAHAEVVLDGTLGSALNLSGPDYKIEADLGQQHGGNLFHSFRDFNLNLGERATFSGPNSVQNIISRVTGGNPSHIFGTLRSTIPNADFYFLNPYGILFGEGASLDVQGSFHASTADTLHFSDGGEFNARFPNNSLLTVAPIESFGFLTDAPATISVEDTELSVLEGKTLSLVGGVLNVSGKVVYDDKDKPALNGGLSANVGRINLASVVSRGEIIPTKFGLDFSIEIKTGQIIVKNATLDVSGTGSGSIFIRGKHFILDNSIMEAKTFGIKDGEIIDIQVDELNIINGGEVSSITFGQGKAGNIKINVTNSVEFSGKNSVGNPVAILLNSEHSNTENTGTLALGNAGNLTLSAKKLNAKDGMVISADAQGTGSGGNVTIQVTDSINFSGESIKGYGCLIVVGTKSTGKAGKIYLEAKRLKLTDGAQLHSGTFGTGDGSNVHIVAESVILSGENSRGHHTMINAAVRNTAPNSSGKGGTIILETENLFLYKGAQITSNTVGTSKGGNINIKAKNIILTGRGENGGSSGFFSSAHNTTENAGDAGDIVVEVSGLLSIKDRARIQASTINGQGGKIKIRANDVYLDNKGIITAGSVGKGNAGNLILQVDKLNMHNSSISTSTEGAKGGNINITSPGYLYLIDSDITTSVKALDGNSGNITLTPEFVVLDNSNIIAQAYEGRGGNIDITTTGIYNNIQGIFESPLIRAINASSQLGIDGEVQINTPEIDIEAGLFPLSTGLLASQRQEGCTEAKLAQLPLKEGFRKAAVRRLLETTWTSFYLSNEALPDTTSLSLTKPVWGCR